MNDITRSLNIIDDNHVRSKTTTLTNKTKHSTITFQMLFSNFTLTMASGMSKLNRKFY